MSRRYLVKSNSSVPLVMLMTLTFALSAQESTPQPTSLPAPLVNPILLIQADLECTFALDDGARELLKAGVIKRIPTTLGEHLVTALTLDRKDQWQMVVNADKPVQKVVIIELQKVRTAREKGEREAAQLEQDIKAKKEQADKIRVATRETAARQAAIKQRREEVQNQVAEAQKQIQQEQVAAQNDDARAQQARTDAASASAQRTTAGALAATANNIAAQSAANSAASHRANIANLQNQLVDLNRQLESPDSGLSSATGTPSGSLPTPGTGLRTNKWGEMIAFTNEGVELLRKKDERRYDTFPGSYEGGDTVSIEKRFYFRWCAGWQRSSDAIYLTKCTFGVFSPNGRWRDYKNLNFLVDRPTNLDTVTIGGEEVKTGVHYQVVFAFSHWQPNGSPFIFPYLVRPKDDPGDLKRGHADRNRKK